MSSDKPKIIRCQKLSQGLRFNTLEQWLTWQESLHFTAIELGLERCRRVANNMSLLKPAYNVISVAGTNGKGSSVTMLDLILRDAGYSVGRYLSPHLLKYNERISVNGVDVSDEELCESFDRIDRARGDISLTYFEFGTLAALDIFRQQHVDIALLEVGLGGRLDAVNILDADAALISSIDLDHQQWLGDNRESIGREKAGIFRNKSPAVCSDPKPPQSILDCANALGTPLYLSGVDFHFFTKGDRWELQSEEKTYSDLPRPMQYSDFQIQNASGVIMLLEKIKNKYPVGDDNIKNGMGNFRLNGRMQMLPGKVQTILDVAHNRESATALINNLKTIPCVGKTHLVVGMLRDKDHAAVLKELDQVADSWSVVSLKQERGCGAEELLISLQKLNITENINAYADVASALKSLKQNTRPDDRIVITGSFLTVSDGLISLI